MSKKDLAENFFPVQFKLIQAEQIKDAKLLESAKTSNVYLLKTFCGGGKERKLICLRDEMVVPSSLKERIVDWYHQILSHPGLNRTEATICQHFWWKELREDVHKRCSTCDTCQRTKKTTSKYGLLPEKEAEAEPWDKLCVDRIGPHTLQRKAKKPLT